MRERLEKKACAERREREKQSEKKVREERERKQNQTHFLQFIVSFL